MKKIYLIFLLFPQLIFAQDFRNIITTGRTYYIDSINNPGYLVGIKPDTVISQGNGDTIFFANNTIRYYSGTYDVVGGILGRTIYKQNNGWFYFFNITDDTLYLKSQALLNESWKFCNLPDKGFIQATCSSIHSGLVLGIQDTSKDISFQSKDSTGSDIPGIYNGKSIQLSGRYGFTKIFDLHHMPGASYAYTLVGRNYPAIGFQGLTWQEVNDFEVGDEFHYHGVTNSSQLQDHIYDLCDQIYKVLVKDIHIDSGYVTYSFEFCEARTISHTFVPTVEHIYTHDTRSANYTYNSLPADITDPFMPEQYINNSTRYYATLYNTNPGRPSLGYMMNYYSSNPPVPQVEFALRLGKILTKTLWESWPFEPSYDYLKLVYYKQGNDTWGIPVATDCPTLIHGIENKNHETVSVFPNPVKTYADISITGLPSNTKAVLAIADLTGRIVFETTFNSPQYRFNRDLLPNGIYILKVNPGKEDLQLRVKIVLE